MKRYIGFILVFATSLALLGACNAGGGGGGSAIYPQNSLTPKEKAVYPAAERQRQISEKKEISDFDMFSSECVDWHGRNKRGEYFGEEAVFLANVASGLGVSFKGSSLSVRIYSAYGALGSIGNGYLRVYADGHSERVEITVNNAYYDLTVVSGLEESGIHTVKILKAIEEDFSRLYISGISCDGAFYTPDGPSDIRMDIYGDSITAGFGILGNGTETAMTSSLWDGTVTFAAKAAEYLGADMNVVCKQGISLSSACDTNSVGFYMKDVYKNYSVYDDTPWDYGKFPPNVIIINLGTNDFGSLADYSSGKLATDGATGAKLSTFIREYKGMISELHAACPEAKILCCLGMMGAEPLYNEIESMVKSLNAGGADYVYAVKLYLGKSGAFGHPSVDSNAVNAEIILETLSAYCGLNK